MLQRRNAFGASFCAIDILRYPKKNIIMSKNYKFELNNSKDSIHVRFYNEFRL